MLRAACSGSVAAGEHPGFVLIQEQQIDVR